MIQSTVDETKFLAACEALPAKVQRQVMLTACANLTTEGREAVFKANPAEFDGVLVVGDASVPAAKPAAKPRERKAPKAAESAISNVRSVMRNGATSTQGIMSGAGLTERETRAAIRALIDAGEAEQVGKGRGAKYVLRAAA